jgi:hypothetical protein
MNSSSPNSTIIKQNLSTLNDQWIPLMGAAKARQELLDKTERLLNELLLLEKRIEKVLTDANGSLKAANTALDVSFQLYREGF